MTMNALALIETSTAMSLPIAEIERAYEYALNEKSPGTRAGYRRDMELFRAWCADRRVDALPASPETVAGYLASLAQAELMPATISRRVSAIRYAHKLA